MEDQYSWKGHSFTLLIFGGVVVLCSIFFTLGMIVGRSQAPDVSQGAVISGEASSEGAEEDDFELRFEEAVEESEPQPLETAASAPEATALTESSPVSAPASVPPEPTGPRVAEPEPGPEVPAAPSRAVAVTLQVAALRNAAQADTLRQEIADKGFPAFILRPGPDDPAPLHRVQVGPFSDAAEVARVRGELEAQGYSSIVRN